MTGIDLMFQLFSLLLGFAVAELLAGLARSWRISAGATKAGEARIRIGWLVPLLGLLVLVDQTHFWLTAYELRTQVAFDYATLLGVVMIVGGYYVISTFVFPDDPAHWPDFDHYYRLTNRTVVSGMIAVNFLIFLYVMWRTQWGFRLEEARIAKSWFSLGAAVLYLPGLVALWAVKSRRANLVMLVVMNTLLLVGALGPAFL